MSHLVFMVTYSHAIGCDGVIVLICMRICEHATACNRHKKSSYCTASRISNLFIRYNCKSNINITYIYIHTHNTYNITFR